MINATHIANQALNLFQMGDLKLESNRMYPRFYPMTLGGPKDQASVGFYFNVRHLKLSLLEFSDEYLFMAMVVLKQRYGNIQPTDRALNSPYMVDDCAIAVRNFVALRVVIDEYMTADSSEALPSDWCYLGDFYHISRDVSDKQMLCKTIRIDIPLKAAL